jgi:peptidoglycan/xylan/chitin deacetylase (PgdA/CDA1 family)
MKTVEPVHGPRLAARVIYGGLRLCGATALRRRLHDAALVLCYHNVVPDEAGDIGEPELHLPLSRFASQIRWLRDHYQIVSLRQLADRMTQRLPLRCVAAITFDDGYQGVFDEALPLLYELGVPATVFIVAGTPERRSRFWWDQAGAIRASTPERRDRWLTTLRGDGDRILSEVAEDGVFTSRPSASRAAEWAAIRAAADRGFDIGAHSTTHRALPALSDGELDDEVLSSRAIIRDATGVQPEFFAYPYGLWDSRSRAAVCRGGYRAGLTLDAGLNPATHDLFCLRRVNVPASIPQSVFEAWAADVRLRRDPNA